MAVRTLSPIDAVPALTVAIATLLAALPWGLPPGARFLLPLLPFAVIFNWSMRRPHAMPEWLAFASGLATDVLSHGPLGFWSLIYLLGFIVGRLMPVPNDWGGLGQWLRFALTLAVLAVVQWSIASGYFLGFVDWQPVARGAVIAALLYPAIALLLGGFGTTAARDDGRFERGA